MEGPIKYTAAQVVCDKVCDGVGSAGSDSPNDCRGRAFLARVSGGSHYGFPNKLGRASLVLNASKRCPFLSGLAVPDFHGLVKIAAFAKLVHSCIARRSAGRAIWQGSRDGEWFAQLPSFLSAAVRADEESARRVWREASILDHLDGANQGCEFVGDDEEVIRLAVACGSARRSDGACQHLRPVGVSNCLRGVVEVAPYDPRRVKRLNKGGHLEQQIKVGGNADQVA